MVAPFFEDTVTALWRDKALRQVREGLPRSDEQDPFVSGTEVL